MLYLLLCNWQISLKIHDEIRLFNRFSICPIPKLLQFYFPFFQKMFFFFLSFFFFCLFVCLFSFCNTVFVHFKEKITLQGKLCHTSSFVKTHFLGIPSRGCLSLPSRFVSCFQLIKSSPCD